MLRSISFALFAAFFLASAVFAETYYVDARNGNDSNSGVSENSAWQTLSKVNAADLGSGDIVLLKRGEAWHGQHLEGRDGLTITAYGAGDRPRMIGTKDGKLSDDAIRADGVRNFTIEDIHILDWGDMGIYAINSEMLTVRNCVIENITKTGPGSPVGIGLNHNTANALVENTIIHDVGDHKEGAGVYIGTAGADHNYSARGNVVRNSEIYNCVVGITIKVHSVDNIIDRNHIHHVVHQGIRSVNQNTITRNHVHDCEEEGIETYNDALVAYNLVHNSYAGVIVLAVSSHFVDHQKVGRNNHIFNNTVSDCVIGISIFNPKTAKTNSPTGNTIMNNLFYSCYRQILIADSKSLPDDHQNAFDYNSYYNERDGIFFRNGAAESDDVDFEGWQRAYGGDGHSLTSDPGLSSAAPNKIADIKLSDNSPCIDAATEVGLEQDIAGSQVPQGNAPDIGAYEAGGSGAIDLPPASPKNVRVQHKN